MAFISDPPPTYPNPNSGQLTRCYYYKFISSADFIVANTYIDRTFESDIVRLLNSGYCEEIEVKISVADFKKDFEKRDRGFLKHDKIARGEYFANRFYFYVPYTIAEKVRDLVPEYAGLITFSEHGYVKKEINAPLLHKEKLGEKTKYRLARKHIFKYWDLVIRNASVQENNCEGDPDSSQDENL